MSASVASFDEALLVERAASCAEQLVRYERRWHGVKTEAAIELAARKHGIPAKVFNALRYSYRWPKFMAAGLYMKLLLAAEHVKNIEERLKSEIRLAEADGLNEENSAAYRAALAALGAAVEEAPALTGRRGRP